VVEPDLSQRLFHAFDPVQPLRRGSERLYVPPSASVVDEFVEEARFAGPHRFLLAGALGSGKSTELHQVLRRLEDDDRYVSILLELSGSFDVRTLFAGQVLFLVALAILATAGEVPKGLKKRLREAYLGIVEGEEAGQLDLRKLIAGLATFVAGVAAGPAGKAAAQAAGKAVEAVEGRLPLPGKGRALDPQDPRTRRLDEVLEETLRTARKAAGGRRVLVLVDGLDKVRLEERIRELFCSGVLCCPDVAGLDLVFSAPPSLRFEVGYGGGAGFSMLHFGLFDVFRRDGTPNEEAVDAMYDVVRRRIGYAGVDPADVLPGGAERGPAETRAITMSGGVVRDLMHILRRAVVHASRREEGRELTADDLEAGIARRALDYVYRLNLEWEELLWRAWVERQRPGGHEGDLLLNENLILTYDGGAPWCRPHPMVMARLEERFAGREDGGAR